MFASCVVVLSFLISCAWTAQDQSFPPGFLFGVATSAYQIEGGWNASDKGENVWDRLMHTQPKLSNYENGDIACDSYHLWKRDIEMCEEMDLDVYRFSISWSRLLPTGFPNIISEDGKNYYNNLIDGLLDKGIKPMVTIYHFDMPQALQDLGGWANPLVSDWFADYARVVYSLFADRVKFWLTINEPFAMCDLAYNKLYAPAYDDTKIGKYLCNKYILIAHAKAWRIYDEEYKPRYGGKVSWPNIFIWFEPKTPDDVNVTQLTLEHREGRYSHPIFSKDGGWPPGIEKYLNDKAKEEGYPYPRLLPFTDEEKELVKGTYDFYALNHYITRIVRKARPGEKGVSPFHGSEELDIILEDPQTTSVATAVEWFTIRSADLRKQLHWLNMTYGVTDFIITENGYVSVDDTLDDWERLKCIALALEQVLLAIQDGLNIMGYVAWSLMDNLEWLTGYKVKFGLYAVDFSDEKRTRIPRASARYYGSVARTRRILYPNEYLGSNYV